MSNRSRDAVRPASIAATARSDAMFAIKSWRRRPTFALFAILPLALGIGVNTAIFSIVNPLLIRALPFPASDRLVWLSPVYREGRGLGTYPVSAFEELKRQSRSFSELTGYHAFFRSAPFALTGGGSAEDLTGVWLAPRFFEALGVQPVAGRLFSAQESQPNALPVVVISHRLWERRFSADPALIGSSILINNDATTVVGVLPHDFDFGGVFAPGTRVDVFAPAPLGLMRGWGNALSLVGRLTPGVSVSAANTELAALMSQLRPQHPEWGQAGAVVIDLKARVNADIQRPLVLLWAAIGLVLLIACVNTSGLLLARTMERRREIAVRVALGATRARITRQLLTEGGLLSLCGAALGIPLAYAIVMQVASTQTMPLLDRVRVDQLALAFTMGIAALSGVLIMAIPAWRISRASPWTVLVAQARGSTDSGAVKALLSALVAVEIALACVLLVGASLLTQSLLRVLNLELGFQPTSAYALRLNLTGLWAAAGANRERMNVRIHELTDQIRSIPEIDAAGLTDALPLDRGRAWTLKTPGESASGGRRPVAAVSVIGPGYMRAMQIAFRGGRDFSTDDLAGPPTIIVNETLARRLWPGQDAIGRTITTDWPGTFTIIGLVADVRQNNLEQPPVAQMYFPYTHVPPGAPDLIIRSALPPGAILSRLRATLPAAAGDLLFLNLRPLEDLFDRATAARRFLAFLISGFAFVALTLSCLGIYGIVSYTVSRRVRDIGVRVALGASRRDIRREIVGGILRMVVVAIGVGMGLAFWATKGLAAFLYDVSPAALWAFAGTAAVIGAASAVAAYVPALRAASLDPVVALRAE